MKDPSLNTNPNQDLFAMGFSRILCLDFDGVFHYYREGWKGPCVIYDVPVPGSIEWLIGLIDCVNEKNEPLFDPQIYSSRSQHAGGISAMQQWFLDNGLDSEHLCRLKFPTEKPAAWLTVDDRCFQFRGVFPSSNYLLEYESWIKQDREHLANVLNDAAMLRVLAAKVSTDLVRERLLAIAYGLEGRTLEDDNPYRKIN